MRDRRTIPLTPIIDWSWAHEVQCGRLRNRPAADAGWKKFEDRTAARKSGAGGVDLLWANRDGLPVIGEINTPTDTSPFLALVQSLTYTSELLTIQQVARLSKAYPEAFRATGGQAIGELLLLFSAADRARLGEEIVRLARALLGDPDGAVARHTRRMSIVNVALEEARDPVFTLRHAVASCSHASGEHSSSPAPSRGDMS